jgi:alkylation response protein AidB-like acyl-CoA dehydrogenase
MDFSFTEDQQEIRGAIKKLLAELVTDDALKALARSGTWFDAKAWGALAEGDMLGLAIPEEYGGGGMGLIELVLLLQQVGRTVAQVPAVPTLVTVARALAAHGSAEQKKRFLPGVAKGETILTAGLVNYDSVDAKRPTAVATKTSDGWAITGTWTNVAYFAQSASVLVAAKTGASSVGVFLVDAKAPGVSTSAQRGTNGEPLVELRLEGAIAPAGSVLGDPAAGQAILDRLVDETTLALAAVEHGLAEAALHMTASYSTERKQFGTPIGAFQGVSQRVGDAYIDLEAMKVTLWQAAWRMSESREHAQALAVAKFWAAEGGAHIVAAAQHVHGGMGFDRDYPLHRYFLTSKHLEFTLGGAQAQLAALGDLVVG